MSREAFQEYWKTRHADLVKSHARELGALRYVQSHTVDSVIAVGGNKARGSVLAEFDGITEFWWASEAAMSPEGVSNEQALEIQKQLLADEQRFIDVEQSVLFVTEEHEIYDFSK